ncbi:MAG TPA: DsbA family protein, partial [Blastocatellia bacterium]|nr:DsbA family protein [Blastocatellia bacterium]
FIKTNSNDSLDPAELPVMAKTLGLDTAKFNACLKNGDTKTTIDTAVASARALNISGTPQSYILVGNDMYTIEGSLPTDALMAVIEEVRK